MISLQTGLPRKFQCVYDAYDFLLHEWTVPLGNKYHEAVNSCREALFGNGCRELARAAFVDVSRIQNCLIDPQNRADVA